MRAICHATTTDEISNLVGDLQQRCSGAQHLYAYVQLLLQQLIQQGGPAADVLTRVSRELESHVGRSQATVWGMSTMFLPPGAPELNTTAAALIGRRRHFFTTLTCNINERLLNLMHLDR